MSKFNFINLLLLFSFILTADDPVRLYLSFDKENCLPSGISTCKKPPRIKGNRPGFVEGIQGKGIKIGGKGSPVIMFQGTDYINPRHGTVMFWAKSDAWHEINNKSSFTFFVLLPKAFLMKFMSGRKNKNVIFHIKDTSYGNYSYRVGTLPFGEGKWFHVALVWLDNVLECYVDGTRDRVCFMREPFSRKLEGQGIRLGHPYKDNYMIIDEFCVLDYPLSANQVKNVFQQPKKPLPDLLTDIKSKQIYASFFPDSHKIYVYCDLRNEDYRKKAVKAKVNAVDCNGKHYQLGALENFKEGISSGYFQLPDTIPAGNISIVATICDNENNILTRVQSEPFVKKVFDWEDSDSGVTDEVIPPYTPLQVNGNTISCWGREYKFGTDGFPEKIISQKSQVLSSPIKLQGKINGKEIKWQNQEFKITSRKPGLITFESVFGTEGVEGVELMVQGQIECDGMIRYDLALKSKEKVKIDNLHLDIPLKTDHAILYHACRDWIRRSNEAGYVPDGEGKVWGSSAKKSGSVLGTFLPYFWLGDYDRGLCWMASNDKEWSVPDNQDCAEFIRNKGTLTARINFITKEKILTKSWKTTFALMAGPPRPEPKGWRLSKKDKRCFFYLPWGNRTCQGYGRPPELARWKKYAKTKIAEGGYWGMNVSPNDFWGVTDENEYFQMEWSANPKSGYPLKKRSEFVSGTIEKLMAEGLVGGIYSDDSYPVPHFLPTTGRGYYREDGKLQAGYSMFELRNFHKRLAALFHKNKSKGCLEVHMTDAMIMPCFSFWGRKRDNEWGRTHKVLEEYPLGEICARSMSRQYGMAAIWHTPIGWEEGNEAADKFGCILLLHDMIGRCPSLPNRSLPAKIPFGIDKEDVEFLGYWLLQPEKDPKKKDMKLSAWVRKTSGTALVVAANLTDKDWQGKIKLPMELMGLKNNSIAFDAENEQHPVFPFTNGEIELSIPKYNYRLIMIGPEGVFPVNLPPPGSELKKPKNMIKHLCDEFNGDSLNPAWKLVCSPEFKGKMDLYRNRLQVLSHAYKFACAERELNEDNISVQVRIEKGSMLQDKTGLVLLWNNGSYVFAGPNMHRARENFFYTVKTADKELKIRKRLVSCIQHWGSPVNKIFPEGVHKYNWIKVKLSPEKIIFFSSSDGKKWRNDWEVDRPESMKGAPSKLRLGRMPEGIDAKHKGYFQPDYFDNLIIGRDE